jgi:type VI secretion system protein VasD
MKSLLSVLLIAFLLTSCSSNQPEPIILNLVINASDDINPSPFSAANPVVINLYQLTALDDFNSAQVLDLYQQDTKFLAATLIQKQNLYSFLPNEQKTISITIQPTTNILAVFAQFSDYSQAKTKASVNISKIEDIESISLTIASLSVNLQPTIIKSFWSW